MVLVDVPGRLGSEGPRRPWEEGPDPGLTLVITAARCGDEGTFVVPLASGTFLGSLLLPTLLAIIMSPTPHIASQGHDLHTEGAKAVFAGPLSRKLERPVPDGAAVGSDDVTDISALGTSAGINSEEWLSTIVLVADTPTPGHPDSDSCDNYTRCFLVGPLGLAPSTAPDTSWCPASQWHQVPAGAQRPPARKRLFSACKAVPARVRMPPVLTISCCIFLLKLLQVSFAAEASRPAEVDVRVLNKKFWTLTMYQPLPRLLLPSFNDSFVEKDPIFKMIAYIRCFCEFGFHVQEGQWGGVCLCEEFFSLLRPLTDPFFESRPLYYNVSSALLYHTSQPENAFFFISSDVISTSRNGKKTGVLAFKANAAQRG
ncbi:hypothetical protein MJG53_003827 [Ovis ammon polii x Ovis aries]|uniref:Uncharacterized protein n=1 Tax=Ovis ammon polii x Ovis aries TaxID=2918886 RepID=A0ACB9V7Z4_9CETA|nr:hypothetical protein MJG53_003827 [Ovis ammon polii x Ovis aries]